MRLPSGLSSMIYSADPGFCINNKKTILGDVAECANSVSQPFVKSSENLIYWIYVYGHDFFCGMNTDFFRPCR